MTRKQKEILQYAPNHLAVALYCGWEWKEKCVRDVSFEEWDDGWFNTQTDEARDELPEFKDLDSIHLIEAKLAEDDLLHQYWRHLWAIVNPHKSAVHWGGHIFDWADFDGMANATAKHRLKALVQTLSPVWTDKAREFIRETALNLSHHTVRVDSDSE